MKRDLTLIRLSYWVAAIVDFIVAILVLMPERMGVDHFVYPMGLMSAVAFSWAVLLIIADRKPLERKWVLPPTALVVFLIGVAAVYTFAMGLIPVGRLIPTLVIVVVVFSLLSVTSYLTRNTS